MMRAADDEVDQGVWGCLRCGEVVKVVERWAGDIVEDQGDESEWDGDGFSSVSDFESGTDASASGSFEYSVSESE
jgi:peroxin-2